jgi:hypothetical protein
MNGREPILSKICIAANVQENVILHYKTFYFGKTCAETWNFSLPKTLDLRKTKLFHDRPSSFCSRYPNMRDRTKQMEFVCLTQNQGEWLLVLLMGMRSKSPNCMFSSKSWQIKTRYVLTNGLVLTRIVITYYHVWVNIKRLDNSRTFGQKRVLIECVNATTTPLNLCNEHVSAMYSEALVYSEGVIVTCMPSPLKVQQVFLNGYRRSSKIFLWLSRSIFYECDWPMHERHVFQDPRRH